MCIDNSVSSGACCIDFKCALTTPYLVELVVKISNVH